VSEPSQDTTSRTAPGGATAAGSTAQGAPRPVLELRGLQCGYGSVPVVRALDLAVESGTVVGVLGPNGAGKTTLMMTLAALLPRLSGEVFLDGSPLPAHRPSAVNRSGLVLVPDDRALFTGLTTRENITIARRKGGPSLADALDLFPALAKRINVAAGALSGGERQMLAVARGMVQKPRVLLIDEMSMGLAPVIVEGLLPVVRRIADETGAVVILVEQHVQLALEVSDRAIVLVHGDVVLSGDAKEIAADPSALESAYLGTAAHASA
jgi:branched-chain amino acid transport system ATP-binding protein